MFGLSLVTFLLIASPIPSAVVHQDKGAESSSFLPSSAPTDQRSVPVHLYMPPNPPAPGRFESVTMGLPYLLAQRTTNYYHASSSQAKNIELVAKRLDGVIVQPGETFSYHKEVGPYTQEHGYGWGRAFEGDHIVPSMAGGVCQGASTLYSALLHTDLVVTERHNHGLTVPYLPAGEDATVAESAHYDFRFRNNQTTPIRITAQALTDKRFLTVAIWSAKPPVDIEVRHRILSEVPYSTVTKSETNCTSRKVAFPGQIGATVETWKELHTDNGITKRYISKDTYLPSPRIVEVPKRK